MSSHREITRGAFLDICLVYIFILYQYSYYLLHNILKPLLFCATKWILNQIINQVRVCQILFTSVLTWKRKKNQSPETLIFQKGLSYLLGLYYLYNFSTPFLLSAFLSSFNIFPSSTQNWSCKRDCTSMVVSYTVSDERGYMQMIGQ